MADHDDIEKVRQEVMRLRELLDIMTQQLQDGERAYADLFLAANCVVDNSESLRNKISQWKVAQHIIYDLSPLRKAVMRLRFDARNMERDFEDLYNIIATTPNADLPE